ncbi:hypothetical protein HPC37_02825 [Pasteurellaceae bacterium 20609_3]|uniref:hypothetical protein n=1 Tax=Spirabiliibacterium mucosae TaxID=28156 RepID=UPI001AADAAA5|nr:hypothetical protein [Spirabiliibacterium mucosae]MBE2897788.1 hypothetical protein [Spirabiliibacterium mucosae]
MSKQDILMGQLPVEEFDETAFTGTGADYEYEDVGTDRGDDYNPSAEVSGAGENEPEPVQPDDEKAPEGETEAAETEPTEPESDKTETDGEDAVPADDKPKSEKPQKRVPYDRLKKEIEKRKAVEAELERMRAESGERDFSDLSVNVDYKVDPKKFEAMSAAMLDGNQEQASAIFAEMMSDVANTTAAASAREAVKRAYEQATREAEETYKAREAVSEAQRAADLVIETYDAFNDTSEAFDEGAFNEVLRVRDGLIATGASAGEAIIEAAELIAARYGFTGINAEAEKTAKPAAKAPNVKAKMEQAAKAPPRVGGETGGKKPEIDVFSLTQEEFDALDPKEVARLRGDFA